MMGALFFLAQTVADCVIVWRLECHDLPLEMRFNGLLFFFSRYPISS